VSVQLYVVQEYQRARLTLVGWSRIRQAVVGAADQAIAAETECAGKLTHFILLLCHSVCLSKLVCTVYMGLKADNAAGMMPHIYLVGLVRY
jgi:hypothetical protein